MRKPVILIAAIISLANLNQPVLAQSALTQAPEVRRGYDREAWGGWAERDGCLSTRHTVLAASSHVRPTIRNCKVVAGRWRDAWTGKEITDPRLTDIDHVVPVQEAHDSGGYQWDPATRHRYFNDVENLVVTDREVNKRKGSYGPEAWLPDGVEEQCFFVRRWIYIKTKWQLSADARELEALRRILPGCPAETQPVVQASPDPNAPINDGELYQ